MWIELAGVMLVITLNPDSIPLSFDLELCSEAGLGAERDTSPRDPPTLFTVPYSEWELPATVPFLVNYLCPDKSLLTLIIRFLPICCGLNSLWGIGHDMRHVT